MFFYLIFSEDAWRIGFGIVFAYVLAPSIMATRELQLGGTILVYLMLISIGWWLFGFPARKITRFLMIWIRNKHT